MGLVPIGRVPEVDAQLEPAQQDARGLFVREVVLEHGHQAGAPAQTGHGDARAAVRHALGQRPQRLLGGGFGDDRWAGQRCGRCSHGGTSLSKRG